MIYLTEWTGGGISDINWSENMKRKHLINLVLLVILSAVLITKYYFYDFFAVPQKGMYPTIKDSGRFLCERRPYKDVSEIKRGDIIAFKAQWRDGKEYSFIWRVVGLPGDNVVVQDDKIIINNSELLREKISEEENLIVYRETNEDVQYCVAYAKERPAEPTEDTYEVPENHVFVLGDNRDDAFDSRTTGPVPFAKIIARKL